MSKSQVSKPPAEIRHLRWMLEDALRHAALIAARCQEATAGQPETLLFDKARQEIAELSTKSTTFQALLSASIKEINLK